MIVINDIQYMQTGSARREGSITVEPWSWSDDGMTWHWIKDIGSCHVLSALQESRRERERLAKQVSELLEAIEFTKRQRDEALSTKAGTIDRARELLGYDVMTTVAPGVTLVSSIPDLEHVPASGAGGSGKTMVAEAQAAYGVLLGMGGFDQRQSAAIANAIGAAFDRHVQDRSEAEHG